MRVVGNDAEAGVSGVFLHNASQSHLSGRCHGIRFVEDDEFEGPEGGCVACFGGGGEDLFRAYAGWSAHTRV